MPNDQNLTPNADDLLDSPDTVGDNTDDTIATPEGDNEWAPDQPLAGDDLTVTRPRGDEPHTDLPLRDATE